LSISKEDRRFRIATGWRERGGAFLRVVTFTLLFVASNLTLNYLLSGIQQHIKTLEVHMLLAMSSIGIAVLVLTGAMAWIGGQRLSLYGYAGPNKWRNFLVGIGSATLLLAAHLATLGWLGFLTWDLSVVLNASLVKSGIICAALFLIVGFTEESIFRGYVLVELSRAISFWPAALLIAVLFGASHLLKGGGENLTGAFHASAIAIAFAFSFRATGSLWLAIGWHAGWDFAQSFIFGVPDSGVMISSHVLHPTIHGPNWLTGGAVGPEGSALTLFMPLALALVSWHLGRRAATWDGCAQRS
jgi:CAAX protease family protein